MYCNEVKGTEWLDEDLKHTILDLHLGTWYTIYTVSLAGEAVDWDESMFDSWQKINHS